MAVGIDLGTTHTVVASASLEASEGRAAPEVFAIPQLVASHEIAARPLLASCLFAPLPGEAVADPWHDGTWIVGEYARRRGAEVPSRLVASSKSWLCHSRVDRRSAILPWGEGEDPDAPRISPTDAAARLLQHVKTAWDDAHPDAPLAEQDVVLTVPASFDEVARELTLEAASRVGIPVRLLEEPQAAFYDFMRVAGAAGLRALLDDGSKSDRARVLVCDVGGGTTDLSLLEIARADGDPPVRVERVAVGPHLLLGGDNMDLALAHAAERRLDESGLDPKRFAALVSACRRAKERLLAGDEAPVSERVTVLGQGAKLIGAARSTDIAREEAARVVLEGFFPLASRSSKPERARGGIVALGLPYERDPAITRHVAAFLARHARGDEGPRAVLLNGGVFHSPRISARVLETLRAFGSDVLELPHADPDLAVARGAVAYALARRGRGLRIGGGSARGYYVGVEGTGEAGHSGRRAICVVPKGTEEGAAQVIDARPLALVIGRPVRFDLFASDTEVHAPGEVVTIEADRFDALPPAAPVFGPMKRHAEEVKVRLEGELSAIGTLDLDCVETEGDHRRFRLVFLLAPSESEPASSSVAPAKPRHSTLPPASMGGGKRLDDAREAIARVFGKGRGDVAGREAKDLLRELERILGDRSGWSLEIARALFDDLAAGSRARRRSADHERAFWLLAGFTLRPGFGDPLDAARISELAPLFAERVLFPNEARVWQQFWIAWRRVAGGLDEAAQTAMRDVIDPLLAPAEARLKKPKGWRADAPEDLLALAGFLERVAPSRRSALGGWVLERTWTSRDPALWAALGRIGARVPAYASAHHVVSVSTAERWIDHLLREKWEGLPTAPLAAAELARVTGDRARDVSAKVRGEVERRLVAVGAREELVRLVRELVPLAASDRAALFGEGLPVGLKLVE